MNESILGIVEESLLNIAKRYKDFSSSPTVLEADLKGFDEQLNDIMDRYNKLKGLQSTYTAEELTIKLNEFQVLYDDLVLKIGNGYFKGADGKSFTYDMFTPGQLALLKGSNGLSSYELALQNGFQGSELEYLESLKGQDGQSLTFDMLTPEQKTSLKGADGQSLTFDMLTPEQKLSLKGADGQSLTFDMLTPEQKLSLKGADGQSLTFDMLTPEQLQQIANLVNVPPLDLTSLTDRIVALETEVLALGVSITPPIPQITSIDGFLFTIANQSYQYSLIDDNTFKIRVTRNSQLQDYTVLFANLPIASSNISKINYKAIYSDDSLLYDNDLVVSYDGANVSWYSFDFEHAYTTTSPTNLNMVSRVGHEFLSDTTQNIFDTSNAPLYDVLKASVSVFDSMLVVANSRNVDCANYIEDIVITLNPSHGIDLNMFEFVTYSRFDNWGQEDRLMEYNLGDLVPFEAVVADLTQYLHTPSPFLG